MRKNGVDQREMLAAAVLRLRSGEATTRSSLAKALAASPSTLGLYVDALIGRGLALETGLDRGLTGRPSRLLSLRPDAGWFAGIEFNADRVQAVRVDFAGQRQAARVRQLAPEPVMGAVVETIEEVIAELVAEAGGAPLGIGLGVPGLVDPVAGTGVHYSFIKDWCQVPLSTILGARFGAAVTVENNLRVIALAERWFGGARSLRDYVILGPRSGFGISIVHGGQLQRGARNGAGEIGRWPWPLDGGRRELHDWLSAPAVFRRLAGLYGDEPVPEDLYGAFARLRAEESEVWREVILDFARVVGCLHLLLDSGVYFLHGPLTGLGTGFCRAVAAAAREIGPALRDAAPQVVASAMGDDAGALGAASLAMESWIPAG